MADKDFKITLHWLNGSRAQGILFLLEALEVPYELEIHHRKQDKLAPPELKKIHPLGKSPVIAVSGLEKPVVLAETPFIVQYLCDHFGQGKTLQPARWKDGHEGKVGGETEEWMRYQYIMYYAEGSFMATFVMYYVFTRLRGPAMPMLVRPLFKVIANQLISRISFPNLKNHFGLLEHYLETSGGNYLCGAHLTGADIVLAYALIAVTDGDTTLMDEAGRWEKNASFKATYPKLIAYAQRMAKEQAWVKSVEKIKAVEGSFKLLP